MANFSDSSGGRTRRREGGSAPFLGLLQRYTFSLSALAGSKVQQQGRKSPFCLIYGSRKWPALCAQGNGKSCAAEILPQRLSGPVR